MRYCALLWSHLSLLLILILGLIDLTEASSCSSYCGNISIPYPFGIGEGCYFNEWFEIQCNNSTYGKLVPYLPKINKEVVSIYLPKPEGVYGLSFEYGSLLIKTKITSTGCSSSNSNVSYGRVIGEVLNFTGSPFTIGASNIFVAVGCNNKATLTNLEPKFMGCMSSCETRIKGDKSKCNGYKCCQADAPVARSYSRGIQEDTSFVDGIQVIGVSIEDIITNRTQSCRVAFLRYESGRYPSLYTRNKLTDPQWFHNRKYVTVQLRWVISSMNQSFVNSLGCEPIVFTKPEMFYHNKSSCQCKLIYNQTTITDYTESLSGSCQCSKGYEGNPYLQGGCKDVDECQTFESNCDESATCVNIPGSYACVSKKNKILKITIGLSVGFGVLIFIGISISLSKVIKRRNEINRKKKYFKRNGGVLLHQQLISVEGNIGKTKVFSSKELEKATAKFCSTRVLGQGGQGTVYKGMLVDGSIVAVKKSTIVDEDKVEEFINEVVILSQINHRNIVKLLGCCLETEVPLLVYEFIPNGNLFEHLHDDDCDDYTMATWEVRLRIALDIAEAVSYLHSYATSPIYHRDIKTMNILLDEKYRGKVSDFGTSRSVTIDHTHLTTIVSGTAGYLDPEYYQSSQFTDKSDVYSFGVVLVELITGQKPISFIRSQENRNLVAYFILAMKENRLVDTIDPRIRDDCKLDQITATAHLAKRCLNLSGNRRPNMRAVAMELERIRSPNGNSRSHVLIVENNKDEVAVGLDKKEEVAVGITTSLEPYDIGVTAPSVLQDNPASTLWLDAEPLFPRQTW